MRHRSHELAIPAGYPPPTELPAEFHSRVKVFEIIDSEYPGYVYLKLCYLLTEDKNVGKYNALGCDEHRWIYPSLAETGRHGPAVTIGVTEIMSLDLVYCVRCLWWLSQAADWPTRHRNYCWPDSATIDRVVNGGCDVVKVAHPQCRVL